MSKRPTIHDVAKLAGVSKSLVALVFKQDSGVSEARRQKVLAAAKQLGYTPNAWARTLRSNSGGFVCIVVADFHNPIFTEVADLARQTLATQGVFSFVATASYTVTNGQTVVDPEPIQHLLDLKPSSLLIVGGLPDHEPFRQVAASIPIVVALANASDLPLAASVLSDDNDAMRQICNHLRDAGHKALTFVGPEGSAVADDRSDAFRRQAKVAGLASDFASTGSAVDEAAGFAVTRALLARQVKPSAVVAFNDNIAFGVQQALDQAQLGQSIAVTGYDDTYIAKLDRINLTSIEQQELQIAQRACELLTDTERMDLARGKQILVAPKLVIRRSSTNK